MLVVHVSRGDFIEFRQGWVARKPCRSFVLLSTSCLFSQTLFLLVFKRLLDLLSDNLGKSAVNLASTIDAQTSVLLRNVVPQEDNVKDDCSDQREGRDDPNDESEEHSEKHDGLFTIGFGQCLKVDPELLKV